MRLRRARLLLSFVALVALITLAACGTSASPTTTSAPPTNVPASASATAVKPTAVPPTQAPPTAVPPTATALPSTGGKVVIGQLAEPDTLDPALSQMSSMEGVMSLIGDSLISRDPTTGKFVPWLAESWSFSDDGLNGTFKLRKDVKWHDGTPFTAKDYEFTFNRALNPETKSIGTGPMLGPMTDAKAVDDYTLEIHLTEPFAPILTNLSYGAYCSPLPKAWFEKNGAQQFARSPMGEGMYRFVDWQTGIKITLQRNPDYKWGPAWVNGPYIDTVEFRYIAEDSTLTAGLEAGEIDFAQVTTTDYNRFKNLPNVVLHGFVGGGNPGYVQFNQSFPLFQDLNVKKALAMAVDRQPIIAAAYAGDASEMYGPVTATTIGYDPVQDTYGYRMDIAGAKAALQASGYVFDGSGVAVKDGQPLKFKLNTLPGLQFPQLAQLLQQQWKAIGVQVEIRQLEPGVAVGELMSGEYEASVMGFSTSDYDVVAQLFGGEAVGGSNAFWVTDPKWDELLLATRTNLDPAKRLVACNAVAEYMIKNVCLIPLAAPKKYFGVSSRVKGYTISEVTGQDTFANAYLEK